MLGVLLDGLILAVLVPMLRENEELDVPKMLLGAALMAGLNWGLLVHWRELGFRFPLAALACAPLVDVFFVRWWTRLSWPRAAVPVAVIFAAKIGLAHFLNA